MKVLCLDTSTKFFSLAVCDNGEPLRTRNLQLKRVLSNSIIPAIKKILSQSGLELENLDGYAVGLGPGSFTSLRVGLSTVKALAYATQKPMAGVCSLDVTAVNGLRSDAKQICVINDARRNLVYAGVYHKQNDRLRQSGSPMLGPIDHVLRSLKDQATIFLGDGIELYKDHINSVLNQKAVFARPALWYPQAKNIYPFVCRTLKNSKSDRADKVNPMYLYPEDCQVRKA